MPGDTILIAAFSARALAQSARRAGFCPLVADAFGDLDTRAAAADAIVVPGALDTGFRAKPLIRALEQLTARAKAKPLGLVLGSGLEDKPRLVSALAARWRLLGADSQTIHACKDPAHFFATLDALGLAHPETRLDPPSGIDGWLSKRIGGSGGRHIRALTRPPRPRPRRYFQRFTPGERLSVGVLARDGGNVFDLTRQWCAPCPSQPFRYGGAVHIGHGTPHHRQLIAIAERLIAPLGLRGMASFDFIVDGDDIRLLEVNPRPGAALDVIDDDEGWAFAAHLAACIGRPPPIRTPLRMHRAASILHADRGALTLPDIAWPEWSADRGAPGTAVSQGAPLATVFADAANEDDAVRLARTRLAELEDLLYGQPQH